MMLALEFGFFTVCILTLLALSLLGLAVTTEVLQTWMRGRSQADFVATDAQGLPLGAWLGWWTVAHPPAHPL